MSVKGIKNKKFENWAKTYTCKPLLYFEPKNLNEIREVLELAKSNNKKIKVIGNGRSPSSIACTNDYMVSLKHFNNILNIDKDRLQVKVESGILLTKLNKVLEENDMSLSVLGAISDLQISGAISVAVHGTGSNYNTICSYISEVELMIESGEIVKYSKTSNSNIFPAVVCSLGSLGILVTVTIQCEKLFKLHSIQYGANLQDVLESLDIYSTASEHFKFFWYPHTDNVICSHMSRTDMPISNKSSWFKDYAVGYYLLEFVLWLSSFASWMVPFINRFYFNLFSKRKESVDVSYKLFNFECLFKQFVYEAAIPKDQTASFLFDLKTWIENNPSVKVHFPVEVRFTKNDDVWLSPCYGQDSCYINVVMYRPYGKTIEHKKLFEFFEKLMLEYNGRPHWAKAHSITRSEFEKLYPKFKEFNELRKKFDPNGLFMNEYLKNVFE